VANTFDVRETLEVFTVPDVLAAMPAFEALKLPADLLTFAPLGNTDFFYSCSVGMGH
jgi:hypothetical protein